MKMKKIFIIAIAAVSVGMLVFLITLSRVTNGVKQFFNNNVSSDNNNTGDALTEENDPSEKHTKESTKLTDVSPASDLVLPAIVSVNARVYQEEYDIFGRSHKEEGMVRASGIITAQNDEEILIVTNNHVVEDVSGVSVTFADGTSAEGRVRATEPSSDLAVIAVPLSSLSVGTFKQIRIATLGDSRSLQLGEMVIAIGNAMGEGQSTTVGYVSALDRTLEDNENLLLIQTDVAINPGNSGGALINARGEVIGINNAKIVGDDVEGVCYAIPISNAIPVIEDLMTRELVPSNKRARLGIDGLVSNGDYGMPKGIYIKEVYEDSAAAKAGVVAGNILIKINNKTIYTQDDYERALSYIRGGSEGTVTVLVLEQGKYIEKELSIVFDKRGD